MTPRPVSQPESARTLIVQSEVVVKAPNGNQRKMIYVETVPAHLFGSQPELGELLNLVINRSYSEFCDRFEPHPLVEVVAEYLRGFEDLSTDLVKQRVQHESDALQVVLSRPPIDQEASGRNALGLLTARLPPRNGDRFHAFTQTPSHLVARAVTREEFPTLFYFVDEIERLRKDQLQAIQELMRYATLATKRTIAKGQ